MKIRCIKVIKRVNAIAARIVPAPAVKSTLDEITRQQRTVVKNWIMEHHENCRLKAVFTNAKIVEWNKLH